MWLLFCCRCRLHLTGADCVQTENESDWRSLQVNQESKSNLGEAIYSPKNAVFKKVGYKPYARW